MNLFELSAKISVDDSAFKKSMENAQKVSKNVANAMKELQSPLDKAKSGFDAIAHPIETAKANFEKLKNATEAMRHPIETFKSKVAEASTALETKRNKLSTLAAGYDSAKKKVDDLTKEFNKSAKESGTSSQKTQELAKKLNEAEKEAEEAKKELDDYSTSVSKAGKNSDSASKGVENFASKLGKGLATAAKIGTAAVGAASGAIVGLTKQSVENYAEYEQLVGGVQTLFGKTKLTFEEFSEEMKKKGVTDVLEIGSAYNKTFEDVRTVVRNADEAYKTAGMSANEYMSTVTSFSASLLQSLGGDTAKAAEYADMAIIDMSDNANKMGTDIEMIKTAYQGFAKQNYTMLDNLKLGYGGTKEEMQRLLEDAEKISGIKYDISSYADIVDAIHVVQDEMGIYGTTAEEAGRTIEGSLNSAKAAWTNLLTGMADEEADFETLIDNFVVTIAGDGTESNLGVIGNILPRIEVALGGAASLVENLLPVIVAKIPAIINDVLPSILSAAVGIVESLVKGISDNKESLFTTVFSVIEFVVNSFVGMLPDIIQLGFDLIVSLATGIAENLPELVPTIISVILEIVNILTDSENLSMLLEAALAIITQLAWGLVDSIPALIDSVFVLVDNIVDFLTDPANLGKLIGAAIELVIAIGVGLVKAIPQLLTDVGALLVSIGDAFENFDWAELGKNLVAGFKQGIKNAWANLKTWFTNLFGDLTAIAKKILGIKSPSRVFKQIGKFVDEGLAIGLEDNADVAFKAVDKLSKGVRDGFDVSLGANYIGTYGISNNAFSSTVMSTTDKLLNELISMFRNGTATTNVGNTRELRRAVNA